MKKMHFYFILVAATLHILSCEFAAVTISPFAPDGSVHGQDKGQILQSPQSALYTNQEVKVNEHQKAYKTLSKLGSRPPNCAQKCRGCKPCVAVQVPKTEGHLGVQYANYKPEGWVCKCGSSLFIP